MRITKGVIAAAGKGTRFLPATKAVPKELLPIVDRPIIQYIVEEFVAAGIKEIVIVTAGDALAIAKHFGRSRELEQHLQSSNKPHLVQALRRLSRLAQFHFLPQRGPYGNGTPCLTAAKIVGREPFVYAFGDDLVLAKSSFTGQMIKAYNKRPGIYLGAQEVPKSEVHKYGIIDPKGRAGEMKGIIEKPDAKRTPSRLANIGRFILPPEIFPVLAKKRLGKGGELWLIDAVHELISRGRKAYYRKVEHGRWYTTGDPVAYLAAVRAFAMSRPDYRNKVKHIFNA